MVKRPTGRDVQVARHLAAEFAAIKFPIKAGTTVMMPRFDADTIAIMVDALKLYIARAPDAP